MTTFRDEAVVLRTHKLGEADRIITLLTRHHGRVRAVAKGVRRTSSRFGSRLEPFMVVDVQLWQGRSLDIVNQVVTLSPYGGPIAEDYTRWTAATAMAETAERMTENEREPATQQFLLLVGALRTLAEGDARPRPRPRRVPAPLAVGRGVGAVLRRLRPLRAARSPPHVLPSRAAVWCARPAARRGPPPRLRSRSRCCPRCSWRTGEVADTSGPRERREASGLVAAYLQWHLERGVRSLQHVERV